MAHICKIHGKEERYKDYLNAYLCPECESESCYNCGAKYDRVLDEDEITVKISDLKMSSNFKENADKELLFRLNDIRESLMGLGLDDKRLYGLDEWSTPIKNLDAIIKILSDSMKNISIGYFVQETEQIEDDENGNKRFLITKYKNIKES